MQPEEVNQEMDGKRKREGLECEQHELNPQKRLKILEQAIAKVQKFIYGQPHPTFTSEEYMNYFSCAFFFTRNCYYGLYTKTIFEKLLGCLQDSIIEVILPALEGKKHLALVLDILEGWQKYKTMAHWLLRFFEPIKNYCSTTRGIRLSVLPYLLFCDWVFDPLWSKLRVEVLRLITIQRNGGVVNRDLLKAAVESIMEIDTKGKRNYYRNLEQVLIEDTAAGCANLASEWFLTCSFNEYMNKAARCMRKEERRLSYYLPPTTMENLMEAMRYEFIDKRISNVVELIFRGD